MNPKVYLSDYIYFAIDCELSLVRSDQLKYALVKAQSNESIITYIQTWAYRKEKIRGAERNLPDFFGLCPTSDEKIFSGTN